MKLNRKVLLDTLAAFKPIVAGKTDQNVLAYALLTECKGRVTVMVTNYDVVRLRTIDGVASKRETALLPVCSLLNGLKKLTEDTVEVTTTHETETYTEKVTITASKYEYGKHDEHGVWVPAHMVPAVVEDIVKQRKNWCTTFKCGRFTLTIPLTVDPSDMPEVAARPPNDSKALAVNAKAFAKVLGRVAYAMSTDETRPSINTACVESDAGTIRVTTTDGHRLATATMPGKGWPAGTYLLPRDVVGELCKLFGTTDAPAKFDPRLAPSGAG